MTWHSHSILGVLFLTATNGRANFVHGFHQPPMFSSRSRRCQPNNNDDSICREPAGCLGAGRVRGEPCRSGEGAQRILGGGGGLRLLASAWRLDAHVGLAPVGLDRFLPDPSAQMATRFIARSLGVIQTSSVRMVSIVLPRPSFSSKKASKRQCAL